MPRGTNHRRNENLDAIMDAVRAGWNGWVVDVLNASGEVEGVESVEVFIRALPRELRGHPEFQSAASSMRNGYASIGRRATYRTRGTAPTTQAILCAYTAARQLGLQPPAPKSYERLTARRRRANVKVGSV